MKSIAVALVFLITLQAQAITWKVYGACSETPVYEGTYNADLSKSLGHISQAIFDSNKIPYVGAPEGYNSILNTPVDLDSIEVVSDKEMRVYGWCFAVNKKMPQAMPHKVNFTSQNDELMWYYAYSTNLEGKWLDDYCSPAYWVQAKQFCKGR